MSSVAWRSGLHSGYAGYFYVLITRLVFNHAPVTSKQARRLILQINPHGSFGVAHEAHGHVFVVDFPASPKDQAVVVPAEVRNVFYLSTVYRLVIFMVLHVDVVFSKVRILQQVSSGYVNRIYHDVAAQRIRALPDRSYVVVYECDITGMVIYFVMLLV